MSQKFADREGALWTPFDRQDLAPEPDVLTRELSPQIQETLVPFRFPGTLAIPASASRPLDIEGDLDVHGSSFQCLNPAARVHYGAGVLGEPIDGPTLEITRDGGCRRLRVISLIQQQTVVRPTIESLRTTNPDERITVL
jgi:hypothetical protein